MRYLIIFCMLVVLAIGCSTDPAKLSPEEEFRQLCIEQRKLENRAEELKKVMGPEKAHYVTTQLLNAKEPFEYVNETEEEYRQLWIEQRKLKKRAQELAKVMGPEKAHQIYLKVVKERRDLYVSRELRQLRIPIADYRRDTRKLPTALKDLRIPPAGVGGWAGPYVKAEVSLIDPWENPYLIECPESDPYVRQSIKLISYGPDQRSGTDDDIVIECLLPKPYYHPGSGSPGHGGYPGSESPSKDAGELEQSLTNSIGMKLKFIPAGEFTMGYTAPYASPQHKVRITKPFYLGMTEVTQKQYEIVMGKNPSVFSKSGRLAAFVKGMDTSDFPVEEVSWEDAVEFCEKLSAKEGVTYWLPTEAEWEYACRAGSTTRYCFGDDESELGAYAWLRENSDRRTHPAGTKKPNAWGLYDMHGNVSEWCHDWYERDYYAESPTEDPMGPSIGSSRVYRGGSLVTMRGPSSFRSSFIPSFRSYSLGFRLARYPSASQPNKPRAGAQSNSR